MRLGVGGGAKYDAKGKDLTGSYHRYTCIFYDDNTRVEWVLYDESIVIHCTTANIIIITFILRDYHKIYRVAQKNVPIFA